MTVKELIAELSKYPGNYEVKIFCDYCGIRNVDCVGNTSVEISSTNGIKIHTSIK